MMYLKKLLLFLLFLDAAFPLSAQIKLPALVIDNMVLQQNTKVNLWGWASPNEKINIQLEWLSVPIETTASPEGNWKVVVDTPNGSDKQYTITLTASNKIVLNNILIGEVWLCSGQSNMFFPVGREEKTWKTGVKNYEEEVKNASYNNIRFFTVALNASQQPLEDVSGMWKVCTPENIKTFSAVAYFFGRDLYQKLNVPIGLISTSWGGTKAEAWTAQNILEEDVAFLPILQEDAKNEKLHQEKLEAYYLSVTNERIASAENAPKGQLKKPKKEPNKTSYVLYNAMLHPIVNYTIKGAIWYQGESNSGKAYLYRTLFPAMVKSWREEWKQGDFPFYYVQITPHKGQNAEIREAQLMALKTMPNSGMVVTTDVGDAQNIHPIDKQTVGHRLALIARAKTYGENKLVYSGPIYKEMKIKKQKIQLFFDYAESGLQQNGDVLKEFEIAGNDQVFYPADAKIDGKTILVSSSQVEDPVAVRFAWKAVPEPNLFNKDNLPASPFRTDDWVDKTEKK